MKHKLKACTKTTSAYMTKVISYVWLVQSPWHVLHPFSFGRHKTGSFGYMDITSSSTDTEEARRNRRTFSYPRLARYVNHNSVSPFSPASLSPSLTSSTSEPTKQTEVQPLLDELSEERLADFLLPLSEFHNRYYTSQSGYDASVFIRDYALDLIEGKHSLVFIHMQFYWPHHYGSFSLFLFNSLGTHRCHRILVEDKFFATEYCGSNRGQERQLADA
jgi:hypothetical protein